MSRRGAGIALIAVAASLYSTRYLSAAILGSGVKSWNAELFAAMLEYTGPNLLRLSVLSLVAGLFYLAWSGFGSVRK